MHIKAKTLHNYYTKKLKIVQNQEKSLWCILKLEEKRQLSNYSSLIRSAILGPVSGYEIDDDPITRVGFRFQVSRLQGFDEVAGEMKRQCLYSGAISGCRGILTAYLYIKKKRDLLSRLPS